MSTETADIESEARRMGWLPLEQFKGKPENWRPADEYVKKGNEFIPFLKADRARLDKELNATRDEVRTVKQQLADATAAIEALKEFKSEMAKERVEEQREQLIDRIAQARESGDVKTELKLQDKLAETRAALVEPAPAPKPVTPPPNIEQTPEWQEFLSENPWFKEDTVKAAAANAIGMRLNAEGKLAGLSQADRLKAIAKATREYFQMDEEAPRAGRVSASRGGSTGAASTAEAQSFDSLPAEVKEAAKLWESRLIGANKAHKDLKSFQAHYAAEYFRKNPNG